jgi:hypothetical protein
MNIICNDSHVIASRRRRRSNPHYDLWLPATESFYLWKENMDGLIERLSELREHIEELRRRL